MPFSLLQQLSFSPFTVSAIPAGNIHDSVAFDDLYEAVCNDYPNHQTVVADSAYKTPHICKEVFGSGRVLSSAYKRPASKREGYRTYDYVYDEFYGCVICPENQVLHYSTTNREGYREYKGRSYICENCPARSQCTEEETTKRRSDESQASSVIWRMLKIHVRCARIPFHRKKFIRQS